MISVWSRRAFARAVAVVGLIGSLTVAPLHAQKSRPAPGIAAGTPVSALKEIGIDQHPNAKMPLDLEFNDERGGIVKLGEFFGPRPVVLALVYYTCPMLCTQVLSGLAGSLQGVTLNVGKDYEVVVVSFDPADTPSVAAERKQTFLRRYISAADGAHVHFLTGRQSSIAALTTAVGFRYTWDQQTSQFAHPAAISVLTPDGRMSRYLYGVEFAPRDLKLALVEASEGRVGSIVDQAMLFCYHYDPETGKYGFVVMNIVRVAGALTVLLMVGFILMSLRRERRQATAGSRTATTGTR
jgi:protein SCO1/2